MPTQRARYVSVQQSPVSGRGSRDAPISSLLLSESQRGPGPKLPFKMPLTTLCNVPTRPSKSGARRRQSQRLLATTGTQLCRGTLGPDARFQHGRPRRAMGSQTSRTLASLDNICPETPGRTRQSPMALPPCTTRETHCSASGPAPGAESVSCRA